MSIKYSEQDTKNIRLETNQDDKVRSSFKKNFAARLSKNSYKYDRNIKYYSIELPEDGKKFGISFGRPRFKDAEDKYPFILSINKGSIANSFPIQTNDQILKISGQDCSEISFEQFITKTNDAVLSRRLEILVRHRNIVRNDFPAVIDNNKKDLRAFDNPNFKNDDNKEQLYDLADDRIDIEPINSLLKNMSYSLKSFEDFQLLEEIKEYLNNDLSSIVFRLYNSVIQIKNQQFYDKPFTFTDFSIKLKNMVEKDYTLIFLKDILSSDEIKGLFNTYDTMASNLYERTTNKATSVKNTDYKDEKINEYIHSYRNMIKVVELERSSLSEPFGITIKNDADCILIGRIIKDSIADQSASLKPNDEILEINDTSIKGTSIDDVVRTFADIEENVMKLVVVPRDSHDVPVIEKLDFIVIRSQFNYSPLTDPYIPCKEIGLHFAVGDLMMVVCREDLNYWQARHVDPNKSNSIGLIPSKLFRQQTEKIRMYLCKEDKKSIANCFSQGVVHDQLHKSKSIFNLNKPKYWDHIERIWSYEFMSKLLPDPFIRRPLILIGHAKCGRREFRERLLIKCSSTVSAAIPHTTKPRLTTESNNDLIFNHITKKQFDSMVNDGVTNIIESGVFNGYNYAITQETVENVIRSGKICLLSLECESAYKIHNDRALKPYVVLISLPNINDLMSMKLKPTNNNQFSNSLLSLPDKELLKIAGESADIVETHRMWVNQIIENTSTEETIEQLEKIIESIILHPQWVPSDWVN